MKTHARVVVIGGGITGCSLLYHLVKLGWSDVVLCEMNELTAGSTWHAAGNTPHYDVSLNMTRIQRASTELYERLEAETGQATGFKKVGSIRIACDRDRLDQFKRVGGMYKAIDLPFEIIGPNEIKRHFPFMETKDVIAGAFTPADGYTDPSSTTNALAKGARMGGAAIYRRTKVVDVKPRKGGGWTVVTNQGTIEARIVVNAAGTWAREVGAKVGLDLPIVSMEHQYLVTEDIGEVVAFGQPFPLLRDPYGSFYLRPEGRGMLFGPYEHGGRPWAVDGVPPEFGQDLLPPDLARIEPNVAAAMERVPVLATAGIKRTVNGPIPHTPDTLPLVGPAPGLRDYWLLCGFSVGIAQGGGVGKALAEWIVGGEPEMEMFEFDPRRYGPHATLGWTVERCVEAYDKMYAIGYPNDEWPGGRPLKATPLYHRLKGQGAVFESRFGWERAAWFAPKGIEARDVPSFRRSNAFVHVGKEVRAVREHAGVIDLSGFAKYEVSGPGAFEALDRIAANRPPRRVGGVGLTTFASPKGRVVGEATICRLAEDRFYVMAAAVAQLHHKDWLQANLPADGTLRLDDVTTQMGVLVVTGPKSRDVLAPLTRADLSSSAFPWLTAREIEIGRVPVRALRVSYVGELGWELHHRFEYQVALYESIKDAGARHGLIDFGTRAMDSMRLEKAYRAWGTDLTMEVTALEAGLERFVPLEGRDFIGRAALAAAKQGKEKWRCVMLTVEAADADANTNAPVFQGDRLVGVVSSGGYGHAVSKSLALAFVAPGLTAEGTRLEVDILGDRRPARVEAGPVWDAGNDRLRA